MQTLLLQTCELRRQVQGRAELSRLLEGLQMKWLAILALISGTAFAQAAGSSTFVCPPESSQSACTSFGEMLSAGDKDLADITSGSSDVLLCFRDSEDVFLLLSLAGQLCLLLSRPIRVGWSHPRR